MLSVPTLAYVTSHIDITMTVLYNVHPYVICLGVADSSVQCTLQYVICLGVADSSVQCTLQYVICLGVADG